MFVLNDDLSIYVTRGDIVFFGVTAEEDGESHKFQAGDVVRIKVYGKKDAENVVLQKEFPVTEETERVEILLTKEDTRIGSVISKPMDYWYEIELNPYTHPQTIIGYDDEGPKVFRLYPEGKNLTEFMPDAEDIPVVDYDLDLTSTRPVQNQAIARAVVNLRAAFNANKKTVEKTAEEAVTAAGAAQKAIEVERKRLDNLVSGTGGGLPADAELLDVRVGADGTNYGSAGAAVRGQFNNVNTELAAVDDKLKCEIALLKNGEIAIVPVLHDGFGKYETGIVSDDSFDGYYKRTGYVYIPSSCTRIEHNFIANDSGVDGIAFYDKTKTYITGYKSDGSITEIPAGTMYIVFSNYDNLREHTGKTITMYAEEGNIVTLVTYGDSHVARGLWQQKVIDRFGIRNHTNLGIGGSTVALNAEATVLPFVDEARIAAVKEANPDTMIIIGGTNDVHLHTPLGTISDLAKKDRTTFYGAYSYLIETLLTWKPELRIVLCTTPQGFYDNIHPVKYSEVSQAVREIGLYYSLPVADIFGKCGINKVNLATYSDDLIHYNALGNDRVASEIISTITGSYLA